MDNINCHASKTAYQPPFFSRSKRKSARQNSGKITGKIIHLMICKISTPKLGIYTSKPYICPVGHKNSRPSAHRQISTFARQRAQTVMSAARERKIARFFLHAATRWHSASYDRFKRNSLKFLQNFFAKNLVCVPKVRTFALANQK